MKREKKLTSMKWTLIVESMIYTALLLIVFLYVLYSIGVRDIFIDVSWFDMIQYAIFFFLIVVIGGLILGYWQSYRIKSRLDKLSDALYYLEKGNFNREFPELGTDEIGKLTDQITKISDKWKEQVESLQRLSTNNAQLAEQARVTAIMEERQRLARELHDAVSQQLFAISMTATATSRTISKDVDRATAQVSLIEEMASVAQSEMRALLLHLRPVHLEGKNLAEGLMELIKELKSKVPISIECEMDYAIQFSKGVENHLFRIVQEAFSNTLRHSKADKMEVRLYPRDDVVRLLIMDNGIGFQLDDEKVGSYGISSMKERVNEIGGHFEIITAVGKGTKIDIRIPILHEEEEGYSGAN
ncbi:sensor histidine kinase [Longirhabdus pacifica]|uniref:sensor histidine kinase n=1 Tax=Longirhabdus pacifica TaxID=2305227 RepID=UPI001008A649|nr:sensor histidine kinase [Longirhabdus pacifica]